MGRHRLDVVCVSQPPDRVVHDLDAALLDGVDLVEGGATRVWTEAGERRFYANGVGGFAVRCPTTGRSVAREVGAAVSAWRGGGDRSLSCTCGTTHLLEDLDYQPAAAFGLAAVHLSDAGSLHLTAEGRRRLERVLGSFVVVGRRVNT